MDEQTDVKEKPSSDARIYGCAKCGSPISMYPPDDVHRLASREKSTFLESVEAAYTCTKCNEVTRLYWGRPVLYRGVVAAVKWIHGVIGQFAGVILGRLSLRLRRGSLPNEEETEAPPMSTESPEEMENRIYDYIMENNGAITVGRASQELGIRADLIAQVIERMTLDGRLKQYAEQTQGNVMA